MKRLSHLRSCR